MFKIYDAHCHIYPEAIALRAVTGIDQFYDRIPVEHFNGTTATLKTSGHNAGITHFLVHSVATTAHQVSSINHFIASEVAASNGAFTGLGTLHPDSENQERDFNELVALGLRGVKLHPDFQRFEADSPKAMRIYELCSAAGIPVLVHTGDYRFDYSNPNRIVNVLRSYPTLKFVGAHFGGWSVWDDAIRLLSDYENMLVDASSTFYAVGRERGQELIQAWGSERVLFGTDYPMWNPQPDINCLIEMELAEVDYRRIFWDNAVRVYGL